MINLEQIVIKINNVLNGTDTEIPSGLVSPTNDNFFFRSFSEGLILTDIGDYVSGKNFCPVIVGALGGQFNPVKGLGEADLQTQVQIYFPVKYKAIFYEMVDYLTEVFVGGYLTFGTEKAVCNISPAQFGELQDFDFMEYKKWTENVYKMKTEVQDTYMAMSFTLYLSTAKGIGQTNGFMYGNSYSVSLTITDTSGNTILTDTSPVFVNSSQTMEVTPNSEQVLGNSFSLGLPNISAYGKTIPLYIKNTTGYANLLQKILDRETQNLIVSFTETFDGLKLSDLSNVSHTSTYFINSVLLVPSKGSLLNIALTLGDRL